MLNERINYYGYKITWTYYFSLSQKACQPYKDEKIIVYKLVFVVKKIKELSAQKTFYC